MPTQPDLLLTLSSGQQVAIDQTGDLQGYPVFFFHGWPASRLQGSGFSVEAREMGVRILSPDRPGVGLSTAQPGRRLLDWPPLVREMARQLGVPRFSVLAVSGGGPYAFATAFALPDLVDAAAIVSGAPPLAGEIDRSGLLPVYRLLLGAYERWPGLMRHGFRWARPFASFRPPRWTYPLIRQVAPPGDRGAVADAEVMEGCIECQREAWRTSGHGVYEDALVYPAEWGFQPEEVRVPIRLWHGKGDTSFSWKLVERFAQRLPMCTSRFVEGEGHYSLPIRRRREILEDLMAARMTAGSATKRAGLPEGAGFT